MFRLVNNMCPGKWVHITYLAVFYITAAVIALFVPMLAKIMLLVKVGLTLMPGNKEVNDYGERPASMIVV